MKKQVNYILVVSVLFLTTLTSYAQDKIIPKNELPSKVQEYIKTNFPTNTIIQATIDKEIFSKSYEVILKDNIKLDFSSKGEITDIDGTSKLPDSVIPKKILNYVKTNYPNNVITSWELDDKNQQIELDNGLDLEFNMNEVFLRIDS